MDRGIHNELIELFGSQIIWNCPLSDYTSFNIGGPADALICVKTELELKAVLQLLIESATPWRIIGRGTNLLIKDSGFRGVILMLDGDFKQIEFKWHEKGAVLHAGAGLSFSRMSSICADSGYSGLEFACGIPGTLGGAVMMNAGAWGKEFSDVILSVETMSESGFQVYGREDIEFSYRKNITFSESQLVVCAVHISLKQGEPDEIKKRCSEYRKKRDRSQPKGLPNAGSIFKNPADDSAGRLIESAGLKGLTRGGAQVSEKHANFILNQGGASADDVLYLMKYIQQRVDEAHGVVLEPEVQLL